LSTDLGGVAHPWPGWPSPALLRPPGAAAHGRFLAVASRGRATRGLPMLAAYCAAKAGCGRTDPGAGPPSCAQTGVTANAGQPGFHRHADSLAESARLYGAAPAPGRSPPSSRWGRLLAPEEVAAALVWLAGDGSSGMTGAVVPVDGGLAL